MATASVSSVSGITAVLGLDGGEFKALTVLTFRYEEELGQPFSIEIELGSTTVDRAELKKLSPNAVVGRNLLVTISGAGGPIRRFHAIMETFVAVDNKGSFNRYRGTAVPWYSLLKLAENSKIYPNTNVGKLLETVHKELGFTASPFALNITPAKDASKWNTRTQHRETYFEFLQRSLHQEGWYYYWTHALDKHVMNTADGSASPPTFHGDNKRDYSTIDYRPLAGDNATTECIYEWSHEAAVQPLKFRLNDYNYGESSSGHLVETVESDYANGQGGFKSGPPFDNLEVFRQPGQYSKRNEVAGLHARRLMQAFTCRQAFVRGKAVCVGLVAGHLFSPQWPAHTNPYLSPDITRYLPTKIILTLDCTNNRQSPAVECEFIAIPWDGIKNRYRPAYDASASRIFGVQSAVVCAAESHTPKGQASENSPSNEPPPIYCDYGFNKDVEQSGPYGRVKVKFHWCRGENERTDWIRLTHLMAGDGWGEFHLPRPGDEVLVAFEHGDPDRPVIVGSLYNDKHPMPFDLGNSTNGDKLKKLFAIKDPGGNFFIMDPGSETHGTDPKLHKEQSITLYSLGGATSSYSSSGEPASMQVGTCPSPEKEYGLPKG
jgi:type VI secretion system secreted protein VgrG